MESDKKKQKKHKTFDPSKYIDIDPEIKNEEALDEVLTLAQRRQRGRVMKRYAAKNARKRKISMRRKASNEKLKARALKRARNIIKARLAGQKKYSELEPPQKIQVDKRLQRISKTAIQTLAKKQLPVVRRKEIERINKMRSANESLDDIFEQFLMENYYTGLDQETKEKRKAHFEKGAAMDDDNPAAYKPAPGDEDAETKPSKYTKRYHKMFKKEGTVNCDRRFKMYREKKNAYFVEQFIADAIDLMETVDQLYENKEIIQKKAEETGIPYRILKKVFDRGVAAWRTGHRPGTTPAQWGVARINSFATGGKTQKTTDADLWAEYKGKNESTNPEDREEGTDSLVAIYKKDTPGETNEQYYDSDISSEYGLFKKGDRVAFNSHSMDYNDDEDREGTVIGSTVDYLKVRCDDGKLYKVRHHDAYLL